MDTDDTLRVAQDRETPVQVQSDDAFTWRYAYNRSADSAAGNSVGQDCLAVRHDAATFVFALCDGVSQSFFGDLAARILADGLVDWLWQAVPREVSGEVIGSALAECLAGLVPGASEQVAGYGLKTGLPDLLRDVLEQKRALGSESTFVCGRIDRPSNHFPAGRAVLAWLGDSRLRLWCEDTELTAHLGNTFHTAERWSTRKGPVGSPPHILVTPLVAEGGPALTRLMAYSDGLALLDGLAQPLADADIGGLIARANASPTSDDISFIELTQISLAPVVVPDLPQPQPVPAPIPAEAEPPPSEPAPAPIPVAVEQPQPAEQIIAEPAAVDAAPADAKAPAPDLEAPAAVRVEQAGRRLHARWRPVGRADYYQVELARSGVWSWQMLQVRQPSWTSAPLDTGEYSLRVRAVRDTESGAWSAWQKLPIQPARGAFLGLTAPRAMAAVFGVALLLAGFALRPLVDIWTAGRTGATPPVPVNTVTPTTGQPAGVGAPAQASTPQPATATRPAPSATPSPTPSATPKPTPRGVTTDVHRRFRSALA